ncbi:MAG: hypothetical protein N4A76_04910 [Firmicutes bacterium]|jgi:hypothetical protein|nr:hypothetical protein [Bacillota bacterium]
MNLIFSMDIVDKVLEKKNKELYSILSISRYKIGKSKDDDSFKL